MYELLTKEQINYYDSLNVKNKRYIQYRGAGFGKTEAYVKAGYSPKTAKQSSYGLEKKNPMIAEIVQVLISGKATNTIMNPKSDVSNDLDKREIQARNDLIFKKIKEADPEKIKQIKFYRDIVNGEIISKKTEIKKNRDGDIVESKEMLIDNVDTRIRARKELDKILGIGALIEIGNIESGSVTINIVDASKKDESYKPADQFRREEELVIEVEDETKKFETEENIEEQLKVPKFAGGKR